MTDLECDLVALARAAVRSGDRESRRFVSSLRLKHKGSMLGEHLTGVCVMAGLPVDVEVMQEQSLAVAQPLVLMRVEVLTQLEHAAAHSAELMGKYKSAFDGVTTDGGSLYAEQVLKKLAGGKATLMPQGCWRGWSSWTPGQPTPRRAGVCCSGLIR